MSTPAPVDSAASAHDEHEEHHLVPYKVFVNVWLVLVLLTGVTVGAAYLDLKHMAFFTAILIASVKCTLVIMYFMHVRYDKPLITYCLIAAFGTYAIFVLLTFADYAFR